MVVLTARGRKADLISNMQQFKVYVISDVLPQKAAGRYAPEIEIGNTTKATLIELTEENKWFPEAIKSMFTPLEDTLVIILTLILYTNKILF
jgi:hypothetical protein